MKLIDLLTEKEKQNIIYKSLSKGEFLFNEGIACEYLGIVISGNIKIISYSFSGNEIIYNSLFEGDIFGNNLIFSSFKNIDFASPGKSTSVFLKKPYFSKYL